MATPSAPPAPVGATAKPFAQHSPPTGKPSGPSSMKPGSLEEDFLHGVHVANSHLSIRMGFLRKVYAILSVQMIVTTAMCALFMMNPAITAFVQTTPLLLNVAYIANFGVLFALMHYRHQTPRNFQLLALFTVFESYLVATIVTFYEVPSVMQAFVCTASVFVGLTLYSFQTKRDFTPWLGTCITLLWVLIFSSVLQVFFPAGDTFQFLCSMAGAALFCVFIVVDTQMMLYKLSADEYILCAINLYLDILNLFLQILRAVGKRK